MTLTCEELIELVEAEFGETHVPAGLREAIRAGQRMHQLGKALQDIDGIAIIFPGRDEHGGFVCQVDRDAGLYESQRGETVEEAVANALSAMGRP